MTSRPRQRGVALLLVLWIFMLLGVLALDFGRYVRDDAMAAVNFADETRGYYAAIAGVNDKLYQLLVCNALAAKGHEDPGDQSMGDLDIPCPPEGETAGEIGGVRWTARVRDEAGRISLNALKPDSPEDEAFLRYVIQNLVRGGGRTTGVDRRMQKTIDVVVDSILDWRDRDTKTVRANGAESDYYRKRDPPYEAKNGEFDSLDELLKVRGVTPDLFYGRDGMPGFRDVFSVRPGVGPRKVNVRRATPAVLLALIGDPDAVENLVAPGATDPLSAAVVQGLVMANSGGAFNAEQYLTDTSAIHIATIEARADVASERNQSRIAALVWLGSEDTIGAGEGPFVLRWWDRAPWDGAFPALPSSQDDA